MNLNPLKQCSRGQVCLEVGCCNGVFIDFPLGLYLWTSFSVDSTKKYLCVFFCSFPVIGIVSGIHQGL